MGIAIVADALSKTYRTYRKQEGLGGALKGLFARKYDEISAAKNVSFQIEEGRVCRFSGTKWRRENNCPEDARRPSGSDLRNRSRAGLRPVGTEGSFQAPIQPCPRPEKFSLVGFTGS